MKSARFRPITDKTSGEICKGKNLKDVRRKRREEKLNPLTEALLDEAPRLRRYAHAILAHWPPPRQGDETRPRVDADAEALTVEALHDVARAAPPADELRRALYRRVTALARLESGRQAAAPRANGVWVKKPSSARAAPHKQNLAQDLTPGLWPAELSRLKTLHFSARAALALVAIEHFTHGEAGAILDLPAPRLLALLAVARQNLSGATVATPQPALRVMGAQDVTPGDLLKYVDGELDPARRDAIAAVLDACPARARDCARWRQIDDRLRQAFGPLLRAPAPRALESAIGARQAKTGFWARLARFFSARAGHAPGSQAGIAPKPL